MQTKPPFSMSWTYPVQQEAQLNPQSAAMGSQAVPVRQGAKQVPPQHTPVWLPQVSNPPLNPIQTPASVHTWHSRHCGPQFTVSPQLLTTVPHSRPWHAKASRPTQRHSPPTHSSPAGQSPVPRHGPQPPVAELQIGVGFEQTTGVWTQPTAGSQAEVVHGLMSSQTVAVSTQAPPTQAKATHALEVPQSPSTRHCSVASHTPNRHRSFAAQATPQAPQFATSRSVSTQLSPQGVSRRRQGQTPSMGWRRVVLQTQTPRRST